jgi:hypothetical protein
LFKEIIAGYSENRTEPVEKQSEQKGELVIVEVGGTCGYCWISKCRHNTAAALQQLGVGEEEEAGGENEGRLR